MIADTGFAEPIVGPLGDAASGTVQANACGVFMPITCAAAQDAIVKVMKRASRSGSQQDVQATGPTGGEESHQLDGRACKICGETDNSQDPVTKKCRRWYRPPKNGKTQGEICWYCGRVWYAVARAERPTLGQYILVLGQNQEKLKTHQEHVEFLTKVSVEAGSHDVSVKWSSCLSSTVTTTQRNRTEVSDDADQHVELEYYKNHFMGGLGDPFTNGLGHRVGMFEGQHGVFVPGAPIKRIKRTKEGIVDKTDLHDDGSLQLSATQMTDMAAALFQGFNFALASGTHVGLLAPRHDNHADVSGSSDGRVGSAGVGSGSSDAHTSSFFSVQM